MLAPLLHPAPRSGEGGPPCAAGWWKGRLTRTSLGRTPPPPPFGWSPSPALRAGADKTKSFSRRTHAPELCPPRRRQKEIRFRQSKREAERRKAHAIHVRAAQTSVRSCATHLLRGCAPTISFLPRLQGRVREGARPPFGAHACGTRHRLSPRWLSPRTGFPADEPRRCFARLALLSAVKHAPCRPVFLPADRGPRAARERIGISARGHRPSLPSFRLALPERRPH